MFAEASLNGDAWADLCFWLPHHFYTKLQFCTSLHQAMEKFRLPSTRIYTLYTKYYRQKKKPPLSFLTMFMKVTTKSEGRFHTYYSNILNLSQ